MLHLQTAFLFVLAAGTALHCRAQNKVYIGSLPQGNVLQQGDRVYSVNRSSTQLGEIFLTLQADGNVVVYLTPAVALIGQVAEAALFATNTVGAGSGPPYTLNMQTDGNLVLYDGVGHPVYYSITFQSAVTQPGAKLALVVDAMAGGFNGGGGKLYPDAEPIYRAAFCVTTNPSTCFVSGYNGTNTQTYFRAPNSQISPTYLASQVGSFNDINLSRQLGFFDQIKEGVRLYSNSANSFLLGQTDGNLVLYNTLKASQVGLNANSAIWQSATFGQNNARPCQISMLNCVLYLLCGNNGYYIPGPGPAFAVNTSAIVYQSPPQTNGGVEGPCFLTVEDTTLQIHDLTGQTIYCAPAGDPACPPRG